MKTQTHTAAVGADCRYVEKADPWSSHARVRAWVAGLPAGTRLLDVGAATGLVGQYLAGAGLVLHGIEPDPQWASQARPYYADLFCGTLEQAPAAFLRDHQAIICADVLEHMADPAPVLRQLVALQPAGCRLLISVPNVANLWVRLNLALGRFDYQERGILDRTHLRFFTRRSFCALLESAGLQIDSLSATPIPLNLVHPFFQNTAAGRGIHASLAYLSDRLPTLLGYQLVAIATKPR